MFATLSGGFGVDVGRSLGDPCEEGLQPWMLAECLGRMGGAGKLGFGERDVDFGVANLMK